MADTVGLMNSPLVTWVQTFREEPLEYHDIVDGVFLNDVMFQIDPKTNRELALNLNRTVEDVSQRLQNWDILLKSVKGYYEDVLQQMIVMKLPNIIVISREPERDTSENEIKKALLLILGCAVQSERKEEFIYNITTLDIDVQAAIMENIQEITDNSENIFALESPAEELDHIAKNMYNHIQRLIAQRDSYLLDLMRVTLENDEIQTLLESHRKTSVSPGISPDKHHTGVELAECKAKLRRLRSEVEEKTEFLAESREEVSENKTMLTKLREENLQLTQEARSARAYRDELDVVREKASRVDKYDAEIKRYKEKLNEMEFFKTRVDELREDNLILAETKVMLEDQLKASHKRVETVIELENELMRYKQQLETMAEQRDHDRKQIQGLTEENARLEYEKKSSLNESANLEDELQHARSQVNVSSVVGTLNDQLNETANAKILRLELENQRLQKKIEDMNENVVVENNSKLLELEKENHRLSKKVEKLQESTSKETKQVMQLEETAHILKREKEKLEQTMETIRESSERQLKELETENEQLVQTLEAIRERNEKTQDLRIQDIEKENKKMHDTVKEITTHVSQLEYENKHLKKACDRSKENINKIADLEEDNRKLEKDNDDLHKAVTTLTLTCEKNDKLEQELLNYEVENRKLGKTVESLKSTVKKLDQLEQANINLTVENQRLQKSIAMSKDSASKIFELETEKDEKSREVQQLKKSIENLKSTHERHVKLEVDLLEVSNENQKLQRAMEAMVKKVEISEKEIQEVENENQKLQKTIETLKVSVRRIEELEKDLVEFESESSKLGKENSFLEKENKKLKQTLEVKEATIDDYNSKVILLEREHKTYKKTVEKSKETNSRVRELEKENKDLLQTSMTEKKTLATLREELVNEKIRTQHLNNELEKLTHELDRIGINKEKLAAAELDHDESRFKALESMLEGELKKSLEIKEDKIHALESRLGESKNRNLKFQEELKSLKRAYEALKQRHEEEKSHAQEHQVEIKESQRHVTTLLHNVAPNPTKDLMEFKDHVVIVERTNATLEAENKNLKSQANKLQDRVESIESQNTSLQLQISSVQSDKTVLQSENAKLQVENTTLQSQSASLIHQNTQLQTQYSSLETEHEHLVVNHEDLQSGHEQLVSDHEALQSLHEQLTSEYEALISEHGSLKANHKSLKSEYQELLKQREILIIEKSDMERLKAKLDKEQVSVKKESKALSTLQLDYNKLQEDNSRLLSSNSKLTAEHKNLLTEYKQVKTEWNTLKLKHTELQGDMAECKDQLNTMDVEVCKTANRCEALSQLNGKLEDENRQLIMQLQSLLQQNQDLLTQTLESKDMFQEEEIHYMEKLSDLRRQKERLEEKIMDQYRKYDPSPNKKNRGFGANLVRKAKGFIARRHMNKTRRQTIVSFMPLDETEERNKDHRDKEKYRSTPNLENSTDSPDNSSLGSYGEGTEIDTSNLLKKTGPRRGSAELLNVSPRLTKQHKHRQFASSTNALNVLSSGPRANKLRVARSTEDLLNSDYSPRQSPRFSPRKENDSMSAGSGSSQPITERTVRPYSAYNNIHASAERRQSNDSYNSGNRHGSISSEDSTQYLPREPTLVHHSRDSSADSSHRPRVTNIDGTPRGSPRTGKTTSPGSEEISLDQYLAETNKTPPGTSRPLANGKFTARPITVYNDTSMTSSPVIPRPSSAINNFTNSSQDSVYTSPTGINSVTKTSTPKPSGSPFTMQTFADRQKKGPAPLPPPRDSSHRIAQNLGAGDAKFATLTRAPRKNTDSPTTFESQTLPRRNKPSPREFTPTRQVPEKGSGDFQKPVSELISSYQGSVEGHLLNNQSPVAPPRRVKDATTPLQTDPAMSSLTNLSRSSAQHSGYPTTKNPSEDLNQSMISVQSGPDNNQNQGKKEGTPDNNQNPGKKEGTPENSVWYEYGCV